MVSVWQFTAATHRNTLLRSTPQLSVSLLNAAHFFVLSVYRRPAMLRSAVLRSTPHRSATQWFLFGSLPPPRIAALCFAAHRIALQRNANVSVW
jgi:hypothetical protein